MNYQVEKCMTCCWAQIHDDRIFCLFAEDTCMKYDQVFNNLKYHRNNDLKQTIKIENDEH